MSLAIDKPIYKTYEDFPAEDLYLYAGIDCIVTSDLLGRVYPKITEKPNYTFFDQKGSRTETIMSISESYREFMAPAFEFIVDLEINGLKYDVQKNREINARMVEEMGQLEEKIRPHVGNINLESGLELSRLLYQTKGFTPPYTTKTGEPSTDGDALKELAKTTGEEWLGLLAKRGDIASTWRTFIRSYVEDFVKNDGRVHPSYSLHGTGSFRISGENPNLTQLPRPKHGFNIRQCYFVDEGNILILSDFSSAEVKVLAAISRDENLLKAIHEGLDFHSFSASKMFDIPYDEFVEQLNGGSKERKEQRQIAKILTFSILYGSSPNGIALALGLPLSKAQEIIDLYFEIYPRIKEYVDNSHRMALYNKYVVSPFGQRKMQYGADKVFKGTAVHNASLRNSQNVLIQGPTSSLGLYCFAKANEAIKKFGAKCTCTVDICGFK